MSIQWEKLAASMAVGVVASSLLATPLNALTVATPYEPTANTSETASGTSRGQVADPEASLKVSASQVAASTKSSTTASAKASTTPAAGEEAQRAAFERWLDRLVWAESNNRAYIRIVDVNGHYSYGCLQFQMPTFRAYARAYGLVSPQDDLYKLIYDCSFQRLLATRMIHDNPGNVSHWRYTVFQKGIGIPPATGL